LAPATGPDSQDFERFSGEMREHLKTEDFDFLERTAAELSRRKERFQGGEWKITRFFNGLEKPAKDSDEATWKGHLARLESWSKRRPESITAATAFGSALIAYGWEARGTSYADSVSEEGWRSFSERLGRAERLLARVKGLGTPSIYCYSRMQDLACAQGWDRQRYEQLFEEGFRAEPKYLGIYTRKATYLLPRWHGKPGEWEKFADAAADRVGGKEGAVIYAHIAWRMSEYFEIGKFFTEARVSWEKVRQGFIHREELYGPSVRDLNAFCLLAGAARDGETARILFSRIGDKWDPDVWDNKAYFDSFKAWVFQ